MEQIKTIAQNAKSAAPRMAKLSSAVKNDILLAIASAIENSMKSILAENVRDIVCARENGRSEAYIDRLTLNEPRISAMAGGLRKLAALADPVGEVIGGAILSSGIRMVKKRVPFGVVGIIYEARPNVTLDAAGICIKTGNAAVLKGGSDALFSNKEIVRIACRAGEEAGLPKNALSLICDTEREATQFFMTLREYIDVLIPRGGAGLIKSVVEHSSIPVIETGVGVCHVFVDESADFDMARRIVVTAKISRPSVCNAIEGLIVHRAIAERFLPLIIGDLKEHRVEIRGDEYAARFPGVIPAKEGDFDTEFLDYILSLSVAEDVEAAVRHINTHGTRHSEAIVTSSLQNAEYFQENVDAAAVYVNASTRFTDGEEFGLGAEIGISTQKLHARGPMGLSEMTTYKYILNGTGQVR